MLEDESVSWTEEGRDMMERGMQRDGWQKKRGARKGRRKHRILLLLLRLVNIHLVVYVQSSLFPFKLVIYKENERRRKKMRMMMISWERERDAQTKEGREERERRGEWTIVYLCSLQDMDMCPQTSQVPSSSAYSLHFKRGFKGKERETHTF